MHYSPIWKLCIMTAMITEIATNGAVANVLLPIVVEMVRSYINSIKLATLFPLVYFG